MSRISSTKIVQGFSDMLVMDERLKSPTTLSNPTVMPLTSSSTFVRQVVQDEHSALGQTDEDFDTEALPSHGGVDSVQIKTRRRDRRCWAMFLAVAAAFFLILSVGLLLVAMREHRLERESSSTGASVVRRRRHKSLEYFLLCVVGGVLSGIPHVLITPLDIVKCRMQCGEVSSLTQGLKHLWAEGRQNATVCLVAHSHNLQMMHAPTNTTLGRRFAQLRMLWMTVQRCSLILAILFKGWAPTMVGYCIQGALKFGFYEYFKYRFASFFSYEFILQYTVVIFLTASACAELIADIGLAPWETVKVKLQTSKDKYSIVRLGEIMPMIWRTEGLRGFYGCLVALWCRQVPYTMVKFTTFEKCAVFVLHLTTQHQTIGGATAKERLVVALIAGYIAGTLCAIVSQPADTVVSQLSSGASMRHVKGSLQSKKTFLSVVKEVGWRNLWKGLSARIIMVGTLSGSQWAIYDGFKSMAGV